VDRGQVVRPRSGFEAAVNVDRNQVMRTRSGYEDVVTGQVLMPRSGCEAAHKFRGGGQFMWTAVIF
jgi:hypothetical protein